MRLEDFDFQLPEEQIAQHPVAQRDGSRLLVLSRNATAIRHQQFPDIVDYFRPGDCLVLNDTRVIPARLQGNKQSGGRIEVFLVRQLSAEPPEWLCLTRCSRTPRPGVCLDLGEGLRAEILDGGEAPLQRLRFDCDGSFSDALQRLGKIPLPPYIRREALPADAERYQTVFARAEGAVAAPTAGLHFTPEILDQLKGRGVEVCSLTLHVGLGTFFPVRCENIAEHRMHSEAYSIPRQTADAIARTRAAGGRVIALGTTTTRALEHAVTADGTVAAGDGMSDLFIYPGFRFRVIDGLVTNFHLPKSTLLMLVSAFAGRNFVLAAYRQAVQHGYRFFSYGDCMLIL
ncbi:tRNA preQ1(34) S-adenosylmethionine ribosyltransferase-isomerase QueA [Geothermobacter hydrogeniphilus]|uniref:S-adenosylmethionine:tRNA ribosyltransferase-isomerase n=1 Tax=Geothermobacter hydrogeniphilus TaxID=1969733 RepID=A0A2K2HBS0_9BACT|nr:tRNA preQ1(34) S-adenosylmethionine ribosyltransferase-isomerase QueA [Geothermobacter hydrogeniphilus]PNU20756.1 tRNA preQ1(34) S-adenosylmethionine ribosyltransferase-isomerase QueA [Geothermobacter hydrogeniphilus]